MCNFVPILRKEFPRSRKFTRNITNDFLIGEAGVLEAPPGFERISADTLSQSSSKKEIIGVLSGYLESSLAGLTIT